MWSNFLVNYNSLKNPQYIKADLGHSLGRGFFHQLISFGLFLFASLITYSENPNSKQLKTGQFRVQFSSLRNDSGYSG